ncbi:hypothetical protein HFO89_31295 [Rhizobium leguminosarum]|uniref:hypothetical protein n=1 Tax=Rhizobium leguminosarum TaxID=384 RepID=UPI001C946EE4|nr:hypothetical protein [Rhizobium leguminosarum]MBY5460763.1 hypothetical protein [Rhizobium leguminosarum]
MEVEAKAIYPARLVNWSGNRSGGVRRLFDEGSGRPGEGVFETNLLHKLEDWARKMVEGPGSAPRILMLVGGPGNGKTEAIESTIGWLDDALGASQQLVRALAGSFLPGGDGFVPRLVRVDAGSLGNPRRQLAISIVQDASAVLDATGRSAAQLLLDELEAMQSAPQTEAYLCCVNRGVLDDALIEAMDRGSVKSGQLLEAITRAVSLAPDAPSCWPLDLFPIVAAWPMDAESLLLAPTRGGDAPARSLLRHALEESRWLPAGSCLAGPSCPFCGSRDRLSREREEGALLQMLRWYELASGKRWSFRDLFSLVSYLLAGHRVSPRDAGLDPCGWAARLAGLDETARRGGKPSREISSSIFQLVSAQYQHALFHRWERDAGPSLLRDIKELGLDDDNTAMGLYWFLSSRRAPYLPTMIGDVLEGLAELLDPALAAPDTQVQVSRNTRFALREVDVRFSRSVLEGLDYVRKLQVLTRLEVELIDRLARLDAELSSPAVRRRRPLSATNLQRFMRDFACRLVRRSLGTKTATALDAPVLSEFQEVIEDGEGEGLYEIAHEVELLLNRNQDFEISLTTTFGQPLPPVARRAILVVPARSVRPLHSNTGGRPSSPIPFLKVGDGRSSQPIALTYDLFKAVKELEEGMSVASLPRTVLALLDTTRARLAGPIVRDGQLLERARIQIGSADSSVVQRRIGFGIRKDGGSR